MFGPNFPYNVTNVQHLRALNDSQIKVIGQKDISIRLSILPETSTRVTFQIIDNDNWSIHLVLGIDFLSQNNLTLLFKPTDKKSKNNLKLINEVASADIIEEDDFLIALTEIKTDFGHDVDKRTYNIVKESYDKLIGK